MASNSGQGNGSGDKLVKKTVRNPSEWRRNEAKKSVILTAHASKVNNNPMSGWEGGSSRHSKL